MTRITDKPVHEATSNGDGTYDGRKLVRWLYEATTGLPMSGDTADELIAEAMAKAKARKEQGL